MTVPATEAVVLDLYGTLVDNFSFRSHEQVVTEMAALLGAPCTEFSYWWGEGTGEGRLRGDFPTVEANIERVCSELDIEPSQSQIARAASVTLEFTRKALVPREGAIEMLAEVRAMGYKLGLISDCSPVVPLLWAETPFAPLIDVPVFSCEVRLKKPDPRIYKLACERLGTTPERCVYLGDGSSDELRGAAGAGMRAMLFCCDYADSYDAHRPGVDGWRGPIISRFENLLPLVRPFDLVKPGLLS